MAFETVATVTSGPNTDQMAASLLAGKLVTFGTPNGPFLAHVRSIGVHKDLGSGINTYNLTGIGRFDGDNPLMAFSGPYRTTMKDCYLNLVGN